MFLVIPIGKFGYHLLCVLRTKHIPVNTMQGIRATKQGSTYALVFVAGCYPFSSSQIFYFSSRYVAKSKKFGFINVRMRPNYSSRLVFTEEQGKSLADYIYTCSVMTKHSQQSKAKCKNLQRVKNPPCSLVHLQKDWELRPCLWQLSFKNA